MAKNSLHTVCNAAMIIGVGYSTLEQWIYKGKVSTVKTPGGHYRISQREIERVLARTFVKRDRESVREKLRSVSGCNQLMGRIVELKFDGLIAQVTLSIGEQQITSIITAHLA